MAASLTTSGRGPGQVPDPPRRRGAAEADQDATQSSASRDPAGDPRVGGQINGAAIRGAVIGGGRRGRGATRRRGASQPEGSPQRQPAAAGPKMRRIGNLSVLLPPAAAPARSLAACLEQLRQQWRRDGHEAALWQAWPELAGPQLAPHCRPLQLHGGVLSVGAPPGPWLQALQYNRHQLLGALRAAGFAIRELRFQQHHPSASMAPSSAEEDATWARHPSRVDVHGLADCPRCRRPAPAGEMARWGHCGFCRRADLAAQMPPPGAEPPPAAAGLPLGG